MEGSQSALRRDLTLFLKVLTGLGYGNNPRVQAAVGYEARCAVAPDSAPPPGPGALGDLEPVGAEEECDVVIVGSGAGGAVAATVLAEAGLDVLVLEAGRYIDRNSYPTEPLAALTALYRDGGLTGRRGAPGDPHPGRPRGRRHHGDQLRHLLPHPGAGARALGGRARDRLGHAARRRLRRGRGDAGRPGGRSRADGPQRPAAAEGRRRARRQPRAAPPQRGRVRAVQLVPDRLPAGRQAGDARHLPAAGGRGRRAHPRRGRGAADPVLRRPSARGRVPRRARRAQRKPPAVHGPRPPGRGPRGRRLRHPRAPHALGLSLARGRARAQPAHPPGVLGRGALRGRGARLGRA